ncbi:MAG: hypothetical protein JW825_03715 [Candidatus Methanofastidiosa archaeon]|nr:hypothetical protein [Candidatus Methanofastidiosa archaeon]
MPQLVKGGKYVFGWTSVKDDISLRIPDEAFEEYDFTNCEYFILISGSLASGGFSLCDKRSIVKSKIGKRVIASVGYMEESDSFTTGILEIIYSGERWLSWTKRKGENSICLSKELIGILGLSVGSKLLVARGSGLGPAFISKGPIFNEAKKHGDLLEY